MAPGTEKASKKLNHDEGFNVSRPTASGTLQTQSDEPMRVDLLDLVNKASFKSKRSNRFELLGSLKENNDDEDIVQNPDAQTSGSHDNTKVYGGNKKKCKKATKVKTQTCEYNKREMKQASREGVSLCVGPEGNHQHQIQDTDLKSPLRRGS